MINNANTISKTFPSASVISDSRFQCLYLGFHFLYSGMINKIKRTS